MTTNADLIESHKLILETSQGLERNHWADTFSAVFFANIICFRVLVVATWEWVAP